MNPDDRPPHSPSAEWGDGTSWVLGHPEKSVGEDRDRATASGGYGGMDYDERAREPAYPQEAEMAEEGPWEQANRAFHGDSYRLWQEFWYWGRRVRRDILALEVWAKSQDPDFRPGGPPDEHPSITKQKIRDLEAVQRWFGTMGHEYTLDGLPYEPPPYRSDQEYEGDPGDPPGGPFD